VIEMWELLDHLFSPFLAMNETLSIFLVACLVATLVNLCYKFLMDQEEVRKLKQKQRELQLKLKEAQAKQDVEMLNKYFDEALRINVKLMRLMRKPLIVSLIPALLFLPWLNLHYAASRIESPLGTIPFGWIGWYVIVSIPMVFLTKKLLRVEI